MSSITQPGTAAEPRRRMAASDRRELILEAARLAFAEGGYHETSLEDVADRAGVSKALLYEHFPSKRELYVAMLEVHVQELIDRITSAVAGADRNEERLRAGVEAFFGFVEERRGSWRIMFRDAGNPDVATWIGRLRDGIGAAIVLLLSEEAEAAFPDEPERERIVQMVAQQLVGAMQSLAAWWDLHPGVKREQVVSAAMDFAWMGLGSLSRGERWRS